MDSILTFEYKLNFVTYCMATIVDCNMSTCRRAKYLFFLIIHFQSIGTILKKMFLRNANNYNSLASALAVRGPGLWASPY